MKNKKLKKFTKETIFSKRGIVVIASQLEEWNTGFMSYLHNKVAHKSAYLSFIHRKVDLFERFNLKSDKKNVFSDLEYFSMYSSDFESQLDSIVFSIRTDYIFIDSLECMLSDKERNSVDAKRELIQFLLDFADRFQVTFICSTMLSTQRFVPDYEFNSAKISDVIYSRFLVESATSIVSLLRPGFYFPKDKPEILELKDLLSKNYENVLNVKLHKTDLKNIIF